MTAPRSHLHARDSQPAHNSPAYEWRAPQRFCRAAPRPRRFARCISGLALRTYLKHRHLLMSDAGREASGSFTLHAIMSVQVRRVHILPKRIIIVLRYNFSKIYYPRYETSIRKKKLKIRFSTQLGNSFLKTKFENSSKHCFHGLSQARVH